MTERRILGGGRTCGVSFCPFPNSSGWWKLISSVFLTRTSCPKTTHANGYYGARPGWAVSVRVLPPTEPGSSMPWPCCSGHSVPEIYCCLLNQRSYWSFKSPVQQMTRSHFSALTLFTVCSLSLNPKSESRPVHFIF